MSGNYVQLQNKARQVSDAVALLRTRKNTQSSAEKEAVQARAAYDSVASEYERRKSQTLSTEEDSEKLTNDIAELRAQRTALQAQKAEAIIARNEAATAVEDKEQEIADLLGEPVTADPMASPPIVGAPSRGIHALKALVDPLVLVVDAQNQLLVTKRIDLEEDKARLAAAEKKLADLKDVRDSLIPSDPALPGVLAEIAATQTDIYDIETEIDGLETEIQDALDTIASTEADIEYYNSQIEALMADYRRAQRELEDDQQTYDDAYAEFQSIANQLEDIEGSVDPGEPTNDADVLDADGAAGSRLKLMVDAHGHIGNVSNAYDYILADLTSAKTTRKAASDAAARAKTTADREVASAEEDLARLRKDLAVLIANQADIEVEAAASLLEDFLKNGSLVTSGAPVVDISVERDIAKTCEDSKVRSLVSRIRAAYLDEDEYKALRAEFRADPVGSFFNTINDPCFALLSEAEVEALRNDIKSNFSKRAAALFDKYFPTRTRSGPVARNGNTLVFVLVVLAVVVAALFLYMKYSA